LSKVQTDGYEVYKNFISENQHRPLSKIFGETNHIERFNCTLRQRVSRLVRKALSFSKKIENHIGAIKYFFCFYNVEKAKALIV
jgi:insertion element IS1 protein InsB